MNEVGSLTSEQNTAQADPLLDFGARVSRYFLDFLETDFKRQPAPSRRIVLKNDANQLTAFSLRKYPKLHQDLIDILRQPPNGGYTVRISRGQYTAQISPILRNLIQQQLAEFPDFGFSAIQQRVFEEAKNGVGTAAEDPERWIEGVVAAFEDSVAFHVVHPFLEQIEEHLRKHAFNAIDSAFEIETELVAALTRDAAEQMPSALNIFLVAGRSDPLEAVFDEFFAVGQSRVKIIDFFELFAASDAYQELRELHSFARRSGENFQLYFYLCDLRHRSSSFPLFYISAVVDQADDGSSFNLLLDSRVFINKAAVDWVAQETDVAARKLAMMPVEERILYPEEAPVEELNKVLGRIQSLFDLDKEVAVGDRGRQVGKSASVSISNTCYFGVFDRTDEALLNDYEALLKELKGNGQAVADLFSDVVKGFLLDDPSRSDTAVDGEWDGMSVPDRLMAESPIPLNEEQRKILAALGRDDVRFAVVQGPPGTGKSHTITAIAFECILKGQTVLILSDKMEALDVVEDKLTQAINGVRVHESFQNPILRLGRMGGTYNKLLAQSSIDKIKSHHKAAKAQKNELDKNLAAARETLRANIAGQIEHLSAIRIDELRHLHEVEARVEALAPDVAAAVRSGAEVEAKVLDLRNWLAGESGKAMLSAVDTCNPTSVSELTFAMRRLIASQGMTAFDGYREAFRLFRTLEPKVDQQRLEQLIGGYQDLRLPILGWLFRGKALRRLNVEAGAGFQLISSLDLHKRLDDLCKVALALPKIADEADDWELRQSDIDWLFEYRLHRANVPKNEGIGPFARLVLDVIGYFPELSNTPWSRSLGQPAAPPYRAVLSLCLDIAEFSELWHRVAGHEMAAPKFDFVGERSKLDQLYATQMTHEMDSRFLSFVETSAATAKTLASVIKKRQKFPTDAFTKLRDAFPCIIAGIREFAEYIPLQRDMFDLVIIDEASQVSVAQAFPALLRAKKILVLGDKRQFSNIKSSQASNEINATYTSALRSFFRERISQDADKLVRASLFDVKKSVIEFFELIANFSIMLRKHFRGYQELISFSSETFYDGHLQAIKVRGRPIEEVIQFTVLDHDGRKERYRNTNSVEADFLERELDALLDEEEPPTVGVITPFREQVNLLNRKLFGSANAKRYEDELKLKIMTFDTCQGEERELVYYSMVATRGNDLLNYIFPVELKDAFDKVEEALKLQRLNVGFSRAQECIHFVLSKEIDEFNGSARVALQHYHGILASKAMPEDSDTDPASPMESKVLQWLNAAPFVQQNRDRIEVQAQFPIGDYLRQLDPFYQHPAYRTDFLLTYSGDHRPISIILEYDGFQEHFTDRRNVHAGNWAAYYRPEDIERQMIIESYGYRFLRLNRFNVGDDPVETLSARLRELVSSAEADDDHELVTVIQKDAADLTNGEKRQCSRCDEIHPSNWFWDPDLRSGNGGFGRVCMPCKERYVEQPPLKSRMELNQIKAEEGKIARAKRLAELEAILATRQETMADRINFQYLGGDLSLFPTPPHLQAAQQQSLKPTPAGQKPSSRPKWKRRRRW